MMKYRRVYLSNCSVLELFMQIFDLTNLADRMLYVGFMLKKIQYSI